MLNQGKMLRKYSTKPSRASATSSTSALPFTLDPRAIPIAGANGVEQPFVVSPGVGYDGVRHHTHARVSLRSERPGRTRTQARDAA